LTSSCESAVQLRYRGSGESMKAFQVYMYTISSLPSNIAVHLFGQVP
jgi:hypothetical protein